MAASISDPNSQYPFETLKTLKPDGKPPETRISNGQQARGIFDRLLRADIQRALKRAKVRGLIDGNPPYSAARRRAAGMADKCNINFRVSESYVNSATGAFYDLTTEAPDVAKITVGMGQPEQRATWERIINEHFNWLVRNEPCLDYDMQMSQAEMTIFGSGPLMFQDEFDWRPVHVLNGQLKVPERAKSEASRWELCSVEIEYNSDQVYRYISDPKTAEARGWNVEATRQAIMRAYPEFPKGGMYKDWEWHQQQLKNGSIYYAMTSAVIRMVHIFFREFAKEGEPEGKISHVCILADRDMQPVSEFLFQKIDQYDSWAQCVHPMYYDRGSGGFHHGVTGMGIKLFSAMELQNRMLCNLADKAMAPKQVFTPTTANQAEEFALTEVGDYSVLSPGFALNQQPIQSNMEDGMVFNREITGLIASNLSQYRQNLQREEGNPITATEAQQRASEQARLNKTQMARYYQQLDLLYSEMYRRVTQKGYLKSMQGGERALEFINRCKADGVPEEVIRNPELVKASRVIGQGSEFMRQQALGTLFTTVLPMLPEGGRDNLIQDTIASQAGQTAVDRYYPALEIRQRPTDQNAEATQWVAAMRVGIQPVVTDSQNALVYATTFLEAGDQAAGTLSQGADPMQVASFIEMVGKATVPYLKKLSQDPSRKEIFKHIQEQWTELAKVHDQLIQHIQDQQQQAQAEQARQQQMMSEEQFNQQLKAQKFQSDAAIKRAKLEAGIQNAQVKTAFSIRDQLARTRQDMALSDAEKAQEMRHSEMQHQADMMTKKNGE